MALDWPEWLIPGVMPVFYIENASRSGGAATNGQEQTIGSMSGRWAVTFEGLPIRTNDQVLEYRAFHANFEGRANSALVPIFDGKRANWPVDQYGRELHPGFTRRKQLNGTQFADPAIPVDSQITARLTAAAARRATTVGIEVTKGAPLKVGQFFSPRPGQLHMVTASLGSGQFRIKPPLRNPEPINTALNLTRPTCEMKLASDQEGIITPRDMKRGTVSLRLVEAF